MIGGWFSSVASGIADRDVFPLADYVACTVKLLDCRRAIAIVDGHGIRFADSVGVFASDELDFAQVVFGQNIVVKF
jgi:hypothetical protein